MNDPSNESRCPRCGANFHCGVGDDAPCACSQVELSPTQRRALALLYPGCLCVACLRAIVAGESVAGAAAADG